MVSIFGRRILSARTPTVVTFRYLCDSVNSPGNLVPSQPDVSKEHARETDNTNASHKSNQVQRLSGFGKSFLKLSKFVNQPSNDESDIHFPTLLRNSKLMQVIFLVFQNFTISILIMLFVFTLIIETL